MNKKNGNKNRETYQTPELLELGDIYKITQASGAGGTGDFPYFDASKGV